MATHRQSNSNTRRFAAATVAAASVAVLTPGFASAAEVNIPNTGIAVEVPGIENVPGIESIPGIEQWIPSLQGSTYANTDVQSTIDQVRAMPGSSAIPGFQDFLDSAAQDVAPANTPAVTQAAAAMQPAVAPVASTGQAIVDAARSKLGAPYAWGATGPNAFDCSGLTTWAYQQAGKNIPRTSGAQASAGMNVPLSQLQPGDIVAYYSGASHVGIYTGNGTIIDALNSGTPVAERPLHYMPIHSAVRF